MLMDDFFDDRGQGQGPAWGAFVVWFVIPLLLFFVVLTFTG